MKPTCRDGHEMFRKDKIIGYRCGVCQYYNVGERWYCPSCWDTDRLDRNVCMDCVYEQGNLQSICQKLWHITNRY